ncbi:MAG: hypothetical protein A2068_05395, partial [Ignavibacteria bacterium GWB2_35_6b]
MNQASITYGEFINELQTAVKIPLVQELIANPGESFVNDLLEIVDSLIAENKFADAEDILLILTATFNEPELYSALALVQKKQNKLAESKVSYEKSIARNEKLYKLYYNYGVLLYEMKDYEEAIESFKKSSELNPFCELCFYNLGNSYREIEDYQKAKEAYENVLNINPDYKEAVYNLGVIEEYLGNRNEALKNYNKTIELDFNNVQAHWNKSLLLLQNGNYEEGFDEYEWRLLKKEFKRYFPFPVWKGEGLTNKKILIYCEQGFGDAIQFVRFVKLIKAKHIAVECRKELQPLFSSFEFINEVIIRDSKIYKAGDYDFTVSIMSLPHLLKINLAEISNEIYIKADEKKSEEWKARLSDSNKLKIGIVWAGNPEHQNDKHRSINVESFLSYLQNEKAEIYNLQLNINKETKSIINKFDVLNFTDNIKDFSDTAAFIQNLDLIISVDTSIAHLAGAMGKETWALLPFNPDWRWLLDGEDSPWYKSVKLFRQKNKDEWNEVFQNVRLNLEQKLSSNISSAINENGKMNFKKKYSEIEKFINNNELNEALKEIEILLVNDPLPYKAFNYLGILFSRTKNYVKAEEYFLKAMNLKPDFTDALSNLAIIYFEQNRIEESIELHKKSVEINKTNLKSYFNLAYAYQEYSEIEKAEENYKAAVKLNPNFADAQFNLALLKLLKGEYTQAWKAYNDWAFLSGNRTIRNFSKQKWSGENFSGKKLYVYPDQGMGDVIQLVRYLSLVKERGGEVIFECQPVLYNLLKNITGFDKIVKTNSNLEITEDYDLHIPLQNLPEIFNTSLETIPNYTSVIKPSEEINQKWQNKIVNPQNYKIGVKLNPNFADAQFNLALLKLLKGEYTQAWKAYNDWAFLSGNRTIRNFSKQKWSGENFSGKKLYVYPDQGMGDVIQLVRYLSLVKERGGEVIFECQPVLYNLLKNITGFDKIVKTNSNLEITEDYDLHIPLQNLPEIFNTSLETIPNYTSVIKPSEEINQKWQNKIVNPQNYKIGFVWTGNPYPPINKKRHASLNDFISLFELNGIDFYSLQIGEEAELLKYYKERYSIYDFTNEIESFEDTAAIINNLDLIITIDTSVAHLAGAMNKKVFTLLPFIPDWRWGLKASATPWYSSMKLFRQKERGNWDTVIS